MLRILDLRMTGKIMYDSFSYHLSMEWTRDFLLFHFLHAKRILINNLLNSTRFFSFFLSIILLITINIEFFHVFHHKIAHFIIKSSSNLILFYTVGKRKVRPIRKCNKKFFNFFIIFDFLTSLNQWKILANFTVLLIFAQFLFLFFVNEQLLEKLLINWSQKQLQLKTVSLGTEDDKNYHTSGENNTGRTHS